MFDNDYAYTSPKYPRISHKCSSPPLHCTLQIIVMDVLVGSAPEYAGLLSLLSPNTGHVWYLSRAFVIMGVCAVVLAPLLGARGRERI